MPQLEFIQLLYIKAILSSHHHIILHSLIYITILHHHTIVSQCNFLQHITADKPLHHSFISHYFVFHFAWDYLSKGTNLAIFDIWRQLSGQFVSSGVFWKISRHCDTCVLTTIIQISLVHTNIFEHDQACFCLHTPNYIAFGPTFFAFFKIVMCVC